jgi:hypothetical protein
VQKSPSLSSVSIDSLIARLTDATYREALQRGVSGSFLEFELALWRSVHNAVHQELGSAAGPLLADCRGGVRLAAEIA